MLISKYAPRILLVSCCVVLFLSGCTSKGLIKAVVNPSGFVSKVYSSQKPLLYVNNLPCVDGVSEYISLNSSTLLSPLVDSKLESFINSCTGCLGVNRLVTPIRLSNVLIGSKFKVVGEFNYYRNRFPFPSTNIHFLILQDANNKKVEISKVFFENSFLVPNANIGRDAKRILDSLKYFDVNGGHSNGGHSMDYCPYLTVNNKQDIQSFLKDFSLSNDVKITSNKSLCDGGSTLYFSTPESFLTSRYYFSEWNLYGKWSDHF